MWVIIEKKRNFATFWGRFCTKLSLYWRFKFGEEEYCRLLSWRVIIHYVRVWAWMRVKKWQIRTNCYELNQCFVKRALYTWELSCLIILCRSAKSSAKGSRIFSNRLYVCLGCLEFIEKGERNFPLNQSAAKAITELPPGTRLKMLRYALSQLWQ